jgi:hypothetical protein
VNASLEVVISGGQTGVDQAALRAAKTLGIRTGGWAPKNYYTERGMAPWLANYGLVTTKSSEYPPRTRANINMADATFIIKADGYDRGTRLTRDFARDHGKRHFVLDIVPEGQRFFRARWTQQQVYGMLMPGWHDVRVLNVAGHRESSYRGIGAWSEWWLTDFFGLFRSTEAATKGDE